MIDIFLSTSVPLPQRHRQFFETADVHLIREAIRALVEVILPVGRITFGGHPAITPLIALYAKQWHYPPDRVTVFQSNFFADIFPKENSQFIDVRYVPAVNSSKRSSLTAMRKTMIRSRNFHAAVLIGGMDGLREELQIFSRLHPKAKLLPVASPGAAARQIYLDGQYPPELENSISFASMFRNHLLRRP